MADDKGLLYITLVAVVAIVGMVAMQSGSGTSSGGADAWDTEAMELWDEDGNVIGEARYRVRRGSTRTAAQQQSNIIHQATTTHAQQQNNVIHQATTQRSQNAVSAQQQANVIHQ